MMTPSNVTRTAAALLLLSLAACDSQNDSQKGTAPVVSSTSPARDASGVALNASLTVTFSEAVDASTLTASTFLLKQPSGAIAGTVTATGVTATFQPTSALPANTTFTATVKAGAKAAAGTALAADYVWTFTTGAAMDSTPPTLSSTVPASAAVDVALGGNVAATFSEAMDPASLTDATFVLKQGSTVIAGVVVTTGVTATFNPTAALDANKAYTATVTTGAKDLAGNSLATDVSWTFTTGETPDTTPPEVSATVPLNGTVGVSLGGNLAAIFSEPMQPLTITAATFTLVHGSTVIPGAVTYSGVTATYNPTSALTANTSYTATITTGARDLAGNALATAFSWTFTTGATADTSAPTVVSSSPLDAATDVSLGGNLAVTFSESMDPQTVTTTTFTLKRGTTAVAGAVSYSGVTATFNPTAALAANTAFTATIATGAKDLAGNSMASAFSWTFTTGSTVDTVRPTVSSTVPVRDATLIVVGNNVTAHFSEAMNPLTLTTSTFTLKQGLVSIPGAVTYSGVTATFNPANPLPPNKTITATLTTGAKDLAGNALATNYTWSFATRWPLASPVNLRTAGNYAILAETQVSTVPASAITGDVAVSPAAATYLTGFSMTADATNEFSTSTQVTGRLYAADYTSPTSSNLTTAIGDMGTAFVDAAGRPPDVTELGAGDVGGMTLPPGVYQWGSGLLIPSDLHLTGSTTDVWIFEVAQNLTVTNGTAISLSGGALPKNVFWQVSGAVSLGTTAHLEGIVLCQTAITLSTGASVNGRLLAQSAVNIDSSTIVEPAP